MVLANLKVLKMRMHRSMKKICTSATYSRYYLLITFNSSCWFLCIGSLSLVLQTMYAEKGVPATNEILAKKVRHFLECCHLYLVICFKEQSIFIYWKSGINRDLCFFLVSAMRRLSSIRRISSAVNLIILKVLSCISSLVPILSLRTRFWKKPMTCMLVKKATFQWQLGILLSTLY